MKVLPSKRLLHAALQLTYTMDNSSIRHMVYALAYAQHPMCASKIESLLCTTS